MVARTSCLALGLLILLVAREAVTSPEIPGAAQKGPIAITGATIHPVSAPAIEDGTLVFDQGRIVAMGKEVKIPAGAKRVEALGRHVYPGLIDADSSLGLVEISSVRATRDSSETGQINPNVKAQVAVNPDSELIPVTRAGGVLSALSAPSGGLISGTSALLVLDGWTWEEMTLRAPVGMHVRWPRTAGLAATIEGESRDSASAAGEDGLAALEQAFADARAYQKARSAGEAGAAGRQARDARWEAMLPVLAGRLPLVVSAEEARSIQAAVAFAVRQEVKLVIVGGYDAPECAALLKQHQVPVIVSGVYRLPLRRSDPYDAAYSVPARLHEAGVKFCIAAGSDWNARNLPYHAGMAAAFGLPPDEALKAITLYPAEILGVAGRLGSLEVGKDATLIVTDGDPLETPTQVLSAFIQGRAVVLSSRHTRLYEKYREKYRRLGRE